MATAPRERHKMIPIKSIPKIMLSTVIATVLFMSIMPHKLNGMPTSVFYLILAVSLLVGWLVATGLFKAVLWGWDRWMRN